MFLKIDKKAIIIFIILIGFNVLALPVLAQDYFGTGYLSGVSGLPTTDVRTVVVNLINILLGILGIIFLVLVIYGGFLWMTSGGDDTQAQKGRKIIGNGIIGLIVIFVAFAIVTFVFNILASAA